MSAEFGLPPVSALGNYKGVMLCNRPPEPGVAGGGSLSGLLAGGTGQAPFKSAIAASFREPWGLPPPRQTDEDDRVRTDMVVKMRGPSAALRRHCQWIKELQGQVKDDRKQSEQDSAVEAERRTRMAKTFKKQRDAIQRIKEEGGHRELDPADVEAILRPPAAAKPRAAGGRKPLWALTEAEKEDAEDQDAALLIQFATDLDFDKYMDDHEFRDCLQVVRDRAKKLQREQDAFKDALVREFNDQPEDGDGGPDGASSCGGSGDAAARALRRYGGGDGSDGRPDWDASTTCGDEKPSAERQAQSLATQALEGNAQLRALHSKGSVQRMVEKAQSVAASDCGAA